MKKTGFKKEYILIVVVIFLFTLVSYFSLTSIYQMKGNARVVNYAGIVRGATQRLVKQELHGDQNDALILRLDSIINDLIHGEGSNELVALPDENFQGYMASVQKSWGQLKEQIVLVRSGQDNQKLFNLSEDYFILVDETVTAAELYSEAQVKRSIGLLIGIDSVFVVILAFGIVSVVRTASLKRQTETLGKLAYMDILTQMPNRASCERELDTYLKEPFRKTAAVLMFDMNNLKRVNDILGHQGGDRIIADFARILRTEANQFGFVGRYGGDEFLGVFPNCDSASVEQFLTQVNEKVISYNLLHVNEVEKISFAAGYIVENPEEMSINDMVSEADKKMYIRKRQMKENKEG